MGLSVIIPSKNARNLDHCLTSIARFYDRPMTIPAQSWRGFRVIVVDDGLHDYGWTNWHAARVIEGAAPFCFARNINLGISAAGEDDVILLNDDALLESVAGFTRMAEAARRDTEFGIVSSAVVGASNSGEHSPKPQCRGLGLIRTAERKDVPFVCVFISRSVINSVGLLDERFCGEIDGKTIYGGEDTDYCLRVRQAGLRLGIYDDCVVEHKTLPSTFRPDGQGLPITAADKRFREIHGHGLWDR